jgi:NADH-quinone oxidoreductase subunit F
MIKFFKHESCGKCTPCREGTHWLQKLMEHIIHGEATPLDIEKVENVAKQMNGKSLCALNDFAINPVLATLKHFRGEYMAYIKAAAPVATKPTAPIKAQRQEVAEPAGD